MQHNLHFLHFFNFALRLDRQSKVFQCFLSCCIRKRARCPHIKGWTSIVSLQSSFCFQTTNKLLKHKHQLKVISLCNINKNIFVQKRQRMLILNTPSSLSHHFHKIIEREKSKLLKTEKDQQAESVTMFSAVYNICVICIVETLKLLGTAILNKTTEYNTKNQRALSDRKVDVTPRGNLLPRRSSSKVVYIQSIKVDPAWLLAQQQQVKQANRHPRLQGSTSARASSDSGLKSAVSPTSKMGARQQRVRHYTFPGCSRSSTMNKIYSRRRSFPLANSLEVIREEDELIC